MKYYSLLLLASVSAIRDSFIQKQLSTLDQQIAGISGMRVDRKYADELKDKLVTTTNQLLQADPKKEDLTKTLKDIEEMEKAYRANWELSIYALEPDFARTVDRIKEQIRNVRTTYKDEMAIRDPKTWTYGSELDYQTKIHMDAVNEAKEVFDRKVMGAHSKIVAENAEKNAANAKLPTAEESAKAMKDATDAVTKK